MPKPKPTRSRRSNDDSAPGPLRAALHAAGAGASVLFRAFTGVLVVGLLVAWVVGRQPLQQAVAVGVSERPTVRFNWPRRAGSAFETWLPASVQQDLVLTALGELTDDPFDRDALDNARARLADTGWFASTPRVARVPGNAVEVTADWRVPVAVVRWRDREFLVSHAGEILRLPPSTPVADGSMPVIVSPHAPPPVDASGAIVFGKPWTGGDIQAAIALLGLLRADPALARLRTIDLTGFMRSGHLTVVSDLGCRLVWGSPIGEVAPGEVPVEKRLGRLRDLVAQRADGLYTRVDIFPPDVLVDKTVPGARP